MKTYLRHFFIPACTAMLLGLAACSAGQDAEAPAPADPNVMTFRAVHPHEQSAKATSRATDTAFEPGDRVGLFLTQTGEVLQPSGNYVNNAALTFDGSAWTPDQTVYWDRGTYDVFAYYPRVASPVPSVDDLPFSVALDQTTPSQDGTLGGYEASDFLFASAQGVEAGDGAVTLGFRHCMSRLVVRLIKGEDFEGELPQDAVVYVHNTVPQATVDLSVGVVTRDPYATTASIQARPLGDHRYAAIVVPQRISTRQPLVEVVMQGVSYLFESIFQFKPGVQHMVSLVISKNPEQVKIEIGGELEDWD